MDVKDAGRKGGLTTKARYGRKYYQKIKLDWWKKKNEAKLLLDKQAIV